MTPRGFRLTALLVLLAAVIAGEVVWRAGAPRRASPMSAGRDAPEDSIAEALRIARGGGAPGADSADAGDKDRWVPVVKGFEAADLPASRREAFVRIANAQRCTCGCGYTLAGCRSYDPSCPVSGPRVERLLDSIRAGPYSGASGARRGPAGGG